nr:hypothetical protein [uncultured bacterium]
MSYINKTSYTSKTIILKWTGRVSLDLVTEYFVFRSLEMGRSHTFRRIGSFSRPACYKTSSDRKG